MLETFLNEKKMKNKERNELTFIHSGTVRSGSSVRLGGKKNYKKKIN